MRYNWQTDLVQGAIDQCHIRGFRRFITRHGGVFEERYDMPGVYWKVFHEEYEDARRFATAAGRLEMKMLAQVETPENIERYYKIEDLIPTTLPVAPDRKIVPWGVWSFIRPTDAPFRGQLSHPIRG